MSGRVYLVGGGCGDFDLITLRGKALIEQSEAVVYDALIDERLLGFAPKNSELICVGKRAGSHSSSQEEINSLLIRLAAAGKTVVRLKGGDPFVFGRGGEEAEALAKGGLPFELVPGISSCIAAPELAGIPVTHRGLARSFHVITAHTADGMPDLSRYAGLEGTLVFLMGLGRIAELADRLISLGKSKDTPAAVISRGGTSRQQTVRGTLSDIAQRAAGLEAPAMIVLGDTAAMELYSPPELPLSGVTVSLTGTEGFSERLGEKLRRLGAETVTAARLSVREKNVDLPDLEKYSWLVLTSSVGVRCLLDLLSRERFDLRRFGTLKLAAVGRATAQALERAGLYPELVPGSFTSKALAEELAERVGKDERVLILRAEKGREQLPDILSAKGIFFDDIKLYDTEAEIIDMNAATDYIVFSSAYGAESFFEAGGKLSERTAAVCIGEVTAAALKGKAVGRVIVPEESTAEGIVDIILKEEDK